MYHTANYQAASAAFDVHIVRPGSHRVVSPYDSRGRHRLDVYMRMHVSCKVSQGQWIGLGWGTEAGDVICPYFGRSAIFCNGEGKKTPKTDMPKHFEQYRNGHTQINV